MSHVFDVYYQRNGEYIRNESLYFADRCLGDHDIKHLHKHDNHNRDFDSIVNDLRHGYSHGYDKYGMSLPELVQHFVGPQENVTQSNVLAAIRAAFTQLYESGNVVFDGSYSKARVMFDMLVACHPKFNTKFSSYLPASYKLDKDSYDNWIVTVTGYDEHIICIDGEYVVLDSRKVVDDFSWVKAARNAVRMFKGCSKDDAGFGHWPVTDVVHTDTISALRRSVEDQINEYRVKHKRLHNGKYVDEVDGKVLSPLNSHVDHYPISFARLVDTWLAEQKYSLEDIVTKATIGDFSGVVMSNEAQRKNWQKYHRKHAQLRIISKQRNLSSQHY